MKNFLPIILSILIFLAACGWNPQVTAVPITPPWDQMNLPVKENAVVWVSSDKEFKAVHKEDKQSVLLKYTEAFKAAGWITGNFATGSSGSYTIEAQKGPETLNIEVYDFHNTGVIIRRS